MIGDGDGDARLAELSAALLAGPHGRSTLFPLLTGDSWPVCAKPVVDEAAETEVEPVEKEASQGEDRPAEWPSSSESMLWLSSQRKPPSSDTAEGRRAIARQ
jgi:hypothetical protein